MSNNKSKKCDRLRLTGLGINTFVDIYCSTQGVFKMDEQFIYITQASVLLNVCSCFNNHSPL